MAEHRRGSIYEDPDLLLLNATLHRMERDRHLAHARRARNRAWLCGTAACRRSLLRARHEHFLSKLLQHTAEVFLAISTPQRLEIHPAAETLADERRMRVAAHAEAPARA